MTKEQAINNMIRDWGFENQRTIELCERLEKYPLISERVIKDLYETYVFFAQADIVLNG